MKRDTQQQFSHLTLLLHWLVGLTMIAMLAMGVYMAETSTYSLYAWHKAIGFLIIFIVIPRVIWRMMNGWPKPASNYSSLEHSLASITHWVLLLGTIMMPISGFLMSALGGYGVNVFGWDVVAFNPDPANPGQALAHNATVAGINHTIHEWLGYTLIGAVLLHVAGAFKHHLIDKDGTLKRMLGFKITAK